MNNTDIWMGQRKCAVQEHQTSEDTKEFVEKLFLNCGGEQISPLSEYQIFGEKKLVVSCLKRTMTFENWLLDFLTCSKNMRPRVQHDCAWVA